MLCALSGQPASDPVVSPRSGSVFHRPLIVAYIGSTGKDPINDEPLTELELITLTAPTPVAVPRPAAYNSIPTMLAAFQNEWDALALETFTLRKQLHVAREELSTALYQYDAAARVAAKAIRERDEAREALVQLSAAFAQAEKSETEASGETPATAEAPGPEDSLGSTIPVALLSAARDSLFALHKNKKITLPVSQTSQIKIDVTSTPLQVKNPTLLAVHDTVVAASETQYQIGPDDLRNLDNISAVAFLAQNSTYTPLVVAQNTIEVSGVKNNIPLTVTHAIAHPTEPVLALLTQDHRWAVSSDKEVYYQSEPLQSATAIAMHVDGILLGVGGDGEVRVFDITSTEQVSVIPTKHAHVNKIQFGLNGYWLVVGSSSETESAVQIFDLRKNSLVHELALGPAADFVLDPSCLILTTYDGALLVHLYVKKGKKWVDNVTKLDVDSLRRLELRSSAEDVDTTKTIDLVGLGETQLHHYTLKLE